MRLDLMRWTVSLRTVVTTQNQIFCSLPARRNELYRGERTGALNGSNVTLKVVAVFHLISDATRRRS